MNTKKTADNSNRDDPVSEKFEKFERNYGGDAVNAHDNRMTTILDENAKELDGELTKGGANRASETTESKDV